ncbi:Trk2p NDAI_0B05360 [Naumovozyma dairenensis CBS 421]|uniref:Potassium transport protein n=1 Tax=Naumovozyma dairenensis (strain ATCC 10597 / BCRC 20456 / CBS 421 / NBRC 0211 / NRRL Y-12639) TaxID=1071378 RepID=G0W708_NAUDC|nr:hypothetical protein NDAI_0B05360 [Naumovozyma dairenensis CBS 421]CCD23569.1 hypothetical protein NDAI_0B05360 [Naumovozyma dairenensis CBS 421]
MLFGRTLTNISTLTNINNAYKKSIGHRLRDFIDCLGTKFQPIKKYIFPNFIAVHYFYIIFVALFTSILIYPVRNQKYIDILFLSAGAATQGGLNTVNTNELVLYQQIVIYIACWLSTPIVIHGCLAGVRLYWFERHFDNIRESSKKYFKARRTKTILERELSAKLPTRRKSTTSNILSKASQNFNNRGINNNYDDFRDKLFSGKKLGRENTTDGNSISNPPESINSQLRRDFNPSNTSGSHSTSDSSPESTLLNNEHFVRRRKSSDVKPQDIYRSLLLLQNQRKKENLSDDQYHGPPLIIDSPTKNNSFTRIPDKNIDFTNNGARPPSSERLVQFEIAKPTRSITRRKRNEQMHPKTFRNTDLLYQSSSRFNSHIHLSPRHTLPPTIGKRTRTEDSNYSSLSNITQTDQQGKPDSQQREEMREQSTTLHAIPSKRLRLNNKRKKLINKRKLKSKLHPIKRLRSNDSNISPKSERQPFEEISFHNYDNPNLIPARTDNQFDEEENLNTSDSLNDLRFLDGSNLRNIGRRTSTYLSWEPKLGPNSIIYGLSKAQKEELGGVEYRAIKLLCIILVIYYVGLHLIIAIMFLPWICLKNKYRQIVRNDGIAPAWWAFFTGMSSFCNLGLSLTPDSMNRFSRAIYPLITMIFFIIAGNTGFPVFLRAIIWVMFKLSRDLSQIKESLSFLLDHPRRCFTLLFPNDATWWLLMTLVGLNGVDLVLFIILDRGAEILKEYSGGYRVLLGLFQAVTTRTAGFSALDISLLHPSIQVSYMLMMYVSVLPLAISMRRTNVYEERSLGIYGKMPMSELNQIEAEGKNADGQHSPTLEDDNDEELEEDEDEESKSLASSNSSTSHAIGKERRESNTSKKKKKKNKKEEDDSSNSYIAIHLRRQLSFDMWFMFLGLFIICICESGKIQDPEMPAINVFSILFEIVSAYGTVGLSLGYPGTTTSLSAQFTALSKLVIIVMLVRGRNRGLPYALDRAIMLPSERLERIDDIEDSKLRRQPKNIGKEDPVSGYFKRHLHKLKNGWRRIHSSANENHADNHSMDTPTDGLEGGK